MALEIHEIPYSGSDAYSILLCRDKKRTNCIISAEGIKVPRGILVNHDNKCLLTEISSDMYPCFIKPNYEGGSTGVTSNLILNEEEMIDAVKSLLPDFPEGLLIEEFIDGTEVTVIVVLNGKERQFFPLGLAEVSGNQLPSDFYRSQEEKIDAFTNGGRTWYPLEQLSTHKIHQNAIEISEQVCNSLNIRDIARIDFRLRGSDLYVIEVNAQPALTEGNTSINCANNLYFNGASGIEELFVKGCLDRLLN